MQILYHTDRSHHPYNTLQYHILYQVWHLLGKNRNLNRKYKTLSRTGNDMMMFGVITGNVNTHLNRFKS